MPLSPVLVSPADALTALASAVAGAKGGDPLAGVTVIVPTNQSGVMARRALGRRAGVAAVDMVTLDRLAELLAGPALAGAGRRPLSNPVLDLTIAGVLADEPGRFGPVAGHPSTIVALRDTHRQLRSAGPEALGRLAATERGGEVARVSRAVTARLRATWYDEADLLATAADVLSTEVPEGLRRVVVHLPARLEEMRRRLVGRLGEVGDVRVVLTPGEPGVGELLERSGLDAPPREVAVPTPARIVSTTDADDEVRVAVDTLVAAARGSADRAPVRFERMAVLWPTRRPYARLVEHHLTAHGIPWNGQSGTELAERIAPRLLLDLLAVDRRGLRRRELFDLLADVPARRPDGTRLPTAEWERVSRAAGVSRDDDWSPRLASISTRDRWSEAATGLDEFVRELRTTLGDRRATRTWWQWADWCDDQLDRWLGRTAVRHLSDPEYRAWEALTKALERLRHLDTVGRPVTRPAFRAVLAAELDDTPVRQGRVGAGVTTGSLVGAAGLDVDVAVVLGGAEGLLPPPPAHDPLLSDGVRRHVGLPTSDLRSAQLRARLHAVSTTAEVTLTVPRGDLRTTTFRQPSRWLPAPDTAADRAVVGSHLAGLSATAFPASEAQRRLRDRVRATAAGVPLAEVDGVADDDAARRALALRHGRAADHLTVFDGDLSAVGVPRLDEPVSPTQIEQWARCPHGYFVRYLLGVRAVEEPDVRIAIAAADRGSLHHEVLDRFHCDVIEGRLPRPDGRGWVDEHRAAVVEHFDRVCDRWERDGRTGRPATWAGERVRMRADLLRWLDHDSATTVERSATPIASEWRFGDDLDVALTLPDGRAIRVVGMIDRVDRCADGSLVVTDHKTGSDDRYRRIRPEDPTLQGTVFQLPAYAAGALALVAARSDGAPADAAPAGDVLAEYGMFEAGRYRRHGVTFTDEVWSTVRRDLGEVVAGIESGWFPPTPERPGFRIWVPCDYCEPDGLGTSEQWARWERKQHDPRLARWFGPPVDPGEVTDG
jgi:hypothetical protein